MDQNAANDSVYTGRYVLVEYDSKLNASDYDKGWYLVSYQGKHIPYGALDFCKTENQYLYFNNPINETHFTAEDITNDTLFILYFAAHKHFTIENASTIYIKVRQNGSYTTISKEAFDEHYANVETEDIPHAHIANEVAHIDNPEAFTDQVLEIYAQVLPGQKYSYNVDGELWSVEDETFQQNEINFKVLRQLSLADISDSPYLTNYNIDLRRYHVSRGYDSTVWQKVYNNGTEKYVMIAELNTVVPTFGVTADAPSLLPISPHFGADSTNVYYDLHWQPSWGFRVKAANNGLYTSRIKSDGSLYLMEDGNIQTQVPGIKTRTNDEVFYPSDQFIQWSHTFENNTLSGDTERKTLYYDYETGTWVETANVQLPGAIYFNKDGFNSTEINYSEDLISEESQTSTWNKYNSRIANSNWKNNDEISLTSTGLSGNLYNAHDGSINDVAKEDIQELSVMLPSIGDTIAQIWDIVYGGRDTNDGIKLTSLRNKDIAWEDAKAEPSRRGLRLVGQGGDAYNTSEVDTLAGAINTAHDLIGMIICSNTAEELEDLERLDMNRIYYDSDHKTYFRKREKYDIEEVDEKTEFNYSETTGVVLNEEEIQKGLYYTYNEITDEYELAEHYIEGTTYYIKKIANPYEELDYELTEFPYTDSNNKTYAWYQDYLSENTRFVENLEGDDNAKKLLSDYVYDTEYHPDRNYFYVNAVKKTLNASYRPKAYWYESIAGNERALLLDTAEKETRGRTYYTFNPNDMEPCSHRMIYVPGIYYYKRITGNGENDFEYDCDLTTDKTQNGDQNVYRGAGGEVMYYQLNIFSTTSQTGEEVIYQAHDEYVPLDFTLNADNFVIGIYYYWNASNGRWERAETFVDGREYRLKRTTYREVKDITQVEIEVENEWNSSQLALYYERTFYTQTKDTNGNVVGIREISRQRFLNERASIFDEKIYTFGRNQDSNRSNWYKTMIDADVMGTGNNVIIKRQDEFYQSGTYHYVKNNSYVLDTNPQFTVGRDYYVLTEVTKLDQNIHFYEEGKYYAENEGEEGYELITDNTLPEDTTFYKKSEYFVINDDLDLLPYGSKWNVNSVAIPNTITLGKKVLGYELVELPNYSVNTNTLNGMLIKIHQLLELDDKTTRSSENLSGLMNQLRDLLSSFVINKNRELVIIDDYGRYHSAPFTGDDYINISINGDPQNPSVGINHVINTITGNDKDYTNLDEGNGYFTVQDIEYDTAGHLTAVQKHKYNLPYAWRNIELGDDTISADSFNGTAKLDKDNWIGITLIDEELKDIPVAERPRDPITDTIKFIHNNPQIDSSNDDKFAPGAQSPVFGDTFEIPTFSVDNKGHVYNLSKNTVTIPNITLTNADSGNVVTGISKDGGAFTETKSNVGELTLIGFTTNSSDTGNALSLATSDSINSAFGKLEKRIIDEENTRSTNDSNLSGQITNAIATEVEDRNTAISGVITTEVADRNLAISNAIDNISILNNTIKVQTEDLDDQGNPIEAPKYSLKNSNTITSLLYENKTIKYKVSPIEISTEQITNFNSTVYSLFTPSSNTLSNNDVCVFTYNSGAFTAKKLIWSDISDLPVGDNALVIKSQLDSAINGCATSDHSHSLTIGTENDGTSVITLSANTKYKLTAGNNTFIFTMGNFAASDHNHTGVYQPVGNYANVSHTHSASEIIEGQLDIARIPDLSSTYAVTGHNHDSVYQPIGSYAASDHNHDTVYQPIGSYAASNHNHDGVYQPIGNYAASDHNHNGVYQPVGNYAALDHNHDGTYQPVGNYIETSTEFTYNNGYQKCNPQPTQSDYELQPENYYYTNDFEATFNQCTNEDAYDSGIEYYTYDANLASTKTIQALMKKVKELEDIIITMQS